MMQGETRSLKSDASYLVGLIERDQADIEHIDARIASLQNEVFQYQAAINEYQSVQPISPNEISHPKMHFAQRSISMFQIFREALVVEIAEKRKQLAYWKRIPTEIWIRIFQIYVADVEEDHIDMLVGHPPFAVLRIGMVCHFWREIVHDLSLLWAYVPILAGGSFTDDTAEMVAYYYEKAKFQPMIGYSHVLTNLPTYPNRQQPQYISYSRFHFRPEHYDLELDNQADALRPVMRIGWRPSSISAIEITDLHIISDNDSFIRLSDEDLGIISSISCVNVTIARSSDHIALWIPTVANSTVKRVSYNSKRFLSDTPFGFVASQPSVTHLELRFSPGWQVLASTRQVTLLHITTLTCASNILERIFDNKIHLPSLRHVELLVETTDSLGVGQWKYFLSIHDRGSQIKHLTLKELSPQRSSSASKTCAFVILALPNLTHLDLYGDLATVALSGLGLKRIQESLTHLAIHDSTVTANQMIDSILACQFGKIKLEFHGCGMIDRGTEAYIRSLLI